MSLPQPTPATIAAEPEPRRIDRKRAADARAGLDPEARWFQVFLFGIAVVGPFSLNIFKPCLPWIMADFRAPMRTVQLSLSLSILAAAVATVLSGPLADRWGRRPVLLASLSLYLAGSVGSATARTIAWLVAGRIVQAASSSVALVTTRAIIHDVFGEARSTKEIARVSLLAVLLAAFAPVLGGVLVDALGWRAVFWTTTALGAALAFVGWTRFPETAPDAGRAARAHAPRPRIGALLTSPVFHGYALQSSLHFAVFFSFVSATSYLMVTVLHDTSTDFGLWVLFVSVFVGSGLGAARWLADRVPSGRMAFAGSLFVCVGCVVVAWDLVHEPLTAAGLFLPASISGFGIGLALPATNAGVMAVVPELAGTGSGAMSFEQYVAAAIFAQIVVQDEAHTPRVLAALSVVGGVAAVLAGLLSVRHGRTAEAS